MTKYITRICLTLAAVLALSAPGWASYYAPLVFNVQGYLTRPDGTPVPDGITKVRFSLFTGPTGAVPLWTSLLDVSVKKGQFGVRLGEQDKFNLPFDDFLGIYTNSYLEIQVGNDPPMTPRLPLRPAPSAIVAASVDDGAIDTPQKIEFRSIDRSALAPRAVLGSMIRDGSITNKLLSPNFTASGPAGGALEGTYPNPDLATRPDSLARVSGAAMTAGAGRIYVDQQQTSANNQSNTPNWQSFTPSRTGLLTGLDLFTGAWDGLNHPATLTIYEGEGVGGRRLARQAITVPPAGGFQHFDFTPPVVLASNGKVTWQISDYSNISVGFNDGGDAYAGGQNDTGVTDYAFKTYMSDGAVGIVGPASPLARVAVGDPGTETSGILVGSPTNAGSASVARVLIAEDGSTVQWPLEVDRNGVPIYGVRPDGSVFSASSRRLKDNIAPLMDGLDAALKLQPVSFDWKPEMGGGHDIGLVAEDAASVLPELAVQSPDGRQTLGVRYDRIGVVALQAIRQQQAVIDRQQEQIASLKSRLAALRQKGAATGARP